MARSPLEILEDWFADLEARDPASLNLAERTDLEALRGLLSPPPAAYVKARRTLAEFDKPGVDWGHA